MIKELYPCLWFNNEAKAAAEFYCGVFAESKIVDDNPVVVTVDLHGERFMLLNGNRNDPMNPAVSFFVVCETLEETDEVWSKLAGNGKVMMALDKYPWSEKYGWLQDKFGVSWQISFGKMSDVGQKFTPSLLFVGERHGKAEEAIRFYTSLFPVSSIEGIRLNPEGGQEVAGSVMHAQFRINNFVMMAMDSSFAHEFAFNESVSFVVPCETQEDIDFYWERLTEGGTESMCGWLKDKYGISWQIVPAILGKLMSEPERGQRVMQAFLKMKKFDIETLLKA